VSLSTRIRRAVLDLVIRGVANVLIGTAVAGVGFRVSIMSSLSVVFTETLAMTKEIAGQTAIEWA
jgi:hypothetical protein